MFLVVRVKNVEAGSTIFSILFSFSALFFLFRHGEKNILAWKMVVKFY